MSIRIKYLGHSSFLFTVDKKTILTDPYFNEKPLGKLKRLINCSQTHSKLSKIDSILISHEHMDACDIDSINELVKKHDSKIIAHCSVLNKLNVPNLNKVPIDEYEIKQIGDIFYKAYPAHHPSSFYPLSYLIKGKNNKTIYFAGDTFMTKDHEKIKPTIANGRDFPATNSMGLIGDTIICSKVPLSLSLTIDIAVIIIVIRATRSPSTPGR